MNCNDIKTISQNFMKIVRDEKEKKEFYLLAKKYGFLSDKKK
jgi:hypothetical protein